MTRVLLIAALLLPAVATAADLEGTGEEPVQVKAPLPVTPEPKPAETALEGNWSTVVPPEVATRVRLSSSDLNRISCSSDIKDALTSTEKGVVIKITGKDAFIKFKVTKRGEKLVYSTTPTEIYVVCGDETYSLVAMPQRIPSQTIRLSSGKARKIRENASLYAGLPFEKIMLRAIQDVYTEQIPESYSIARPERRFDSFREIRLILNRVVDIEGEGLRIKEYLVSLKEGTKEFRMNEKMFIRTDLAENPVAISLERHILRPGETVRAFVVEQRGKRQGISGRLEPDLPVLENPPKEKKAAPAREPDRTSPRKQEADDER